MDPTDPPASDPPDPPDPPDPSDASRCRCPDRSFRHTFDHGDAEHRTIPRRSTVAPKTVEESSRRDVENPRPAPSQG